MEIFSSNPGYTEHERSGQNGPSLWNDLSKPLFEPVHPELSQTSLYAIRFGVTIYTFGIVTYAVGSCQLYGGARTAFDDQDVAYNDVASYKYCAGAWNWLGWGIIGGILMVIGLLVMTLADTDLNQQLGSNKLMALGLCFAHAMSAGITAFSIPPISRIHFLLWIPWVYFLYRFNPILNQEPGYPRFTELWTFIFFLNHSIWAVYFLLTAWSLWDVHFIIVGVFFMLGAISIVLVYRYDKKESPTARCYVAIFAFLIAWGIADLSYGIVLITFQKVDVPGTKWLMPATFILPTLMVITFYRLMGFSLSPRHIDLSEGYELRPSMMDRSWGGGDARDDWVDARHA
jgi:hypothetical protein